MSLLRADRKKAAWQLGGITWPSSSSVLYHLALRQFSSPRMQVLLLISPDLLNFKIFLKSCLCLGEEAVLCSAGF